MTMRWAMPLCILFSLLLLSPPASFAQSSDSDEGAIPVTGRVLAEGTDQPVADASVELLELTSGFPVRETVQSGEDGRFRFESVEFGRFGIRIRAKGLAVVARGFIVQADMRPLEFSLSPAVVITGRLVDEADGEPIEGASLAVGMAVAITDADGRFELDGVPRSAPAAPGAPAASDTPIAVLIVAGDYLRTEHAVPRDGSAAVDVGDIQLAKGAAFELRLRDEGGDPVAGVSALVYPLDLRRFPTRGTDNVFAQSDENEVLRVRGLPHEPRYAVQLDAGDWPQHVVSPVTTVVGREPTPRAVTLTHGYPLAGRVVSFRGEPIRGATVRLGPLVNPVAHFTWDSPEQERGFTASTDAKGRFVLEDVAFGDFLLEVNASNARTHRRVVRVHPGRVPGLMFVTLRSGAPAQDVAWRPSMADALDQSVVENAPVFLFMTMDGEVANEYTAANTWKQPGLVFLANQAIPVVSSTFDHSDDPNAVCPKFGSVTCAEHTAAEEPIATMFLSPVYSEVPQFIFLRPSGEIVERRMFYSGFESLRNLIQRALREVNPARALAAASEYYEDLVDAMRFGSPTERAAAIRDLCLLADNVDEVARTALLAVDLSSLSPDQEIEILERFLPGAEENRVWFISALIREGSPSLRAEAIRRLGLESNDAAWDTLVAALGDAEDFRSRAALESALGIRRERDSVRFPGIDRARKARLVSALARQADPAVLEHLFETIGSNVDAEVRNDAALSLTRYPVNRVLPFLVEQLRRGGPEQAIVARVIGDVGDPRALAPLRETMNDPSVVLRISVARSLGLLGDDTALPLLRDILDREGVDASVRVAVASAMLELGSDDGVPVLIELSDHPVHGPNARARLRDAYASRPPRDAREWGNWWDRTKGQ